MTLAQHFGLCIVEASGFWGLVYDVIYVDQHRFFADGGGGAPS